MVPSAHEECEDVSEITTQTKYLVGILKDHLLCSLPRLESEAKRRPSLKIFLSVRDDLTKSEHEGSASVSGAINLLSTLQCQHIVARNLAEELNLDISDRKFTFCPF